MTDAYGLMSMILLNHCLALQQVAKSPAGCSPHKHQEEKIPEGKYKAFALPTAAE